MSCYQGEVFSDPTIFTRQQQLKLETHVSCELPVGQSDSRRPKPTSARIVVFEELGQRLPSTANTYHDAAVEKSNQIQLAFVTELQPRTQPSTQHISAGNNQSINHYKPILLTLYVESNVRTPLVFRVTVARAWNSLPTSITALTSLPSFKRQLKTFFIYQILPISLIFSL